MTTDLSAQKLYMLHKHAVHMFATLLFFKADLKWVTQHCLFLHLPMSLMTQACVYR